MTGFASGHNFNRHTRKLSLKRDLRDSHRSQYYESNISAYQSVCLS